jgi:ATP-binding cassette subfamily C protein
MRRLVGLVRPLTGYMILAIAMGLIGHLCAAFITVFGGYAIVKVLKGQELPFLLASVLAFALVRGFVR